MKSYTRIFLKHYGYDVSDFIPCLGCGQKSVDLHHLEPRSKRKDLENEPTNLAALCRECHVKAETNKEFNNQLKQLKNATKK